MGEEKLGFFEEKKQYWCSNKALLMGEEKLGFFVEKIQRSYDLGIRPLWGNE